MTFDPETIMAYVDGELDLVTAKRIERVMETDDALRASIEAQRRLRARLNARFDPVIEEPVPDRLAALLAHVDTSLDGRREAKRARRFAAPQWAAIAATLVVGVMVGQFAGKSGDGPVGSSGGTLVARAALARALDTQLASSQPANAAVRIGLTFRDGAGTVCRTFEQPQLSGIACKAANGWSLRELISGAGKGQDYRQASSAPMAERAAAMMAGDPFDARAEADARKAGWR